MHPRHETILSRLIGIIFWNAWLYDLYEMKSPMEVINYYQEKRK